MASRKATVAAEHLGVALKSGPAAIASDLASVSNNDQSAMIGSSGASAPGVSSALSLGDLQDKRGHTTGADLDVKTGEV